MIGLVFLHGWGYGPEAWADMAGAFPERPTVLLDAGYRGAPQYAIPENPAGWVGVGHSLGFPKLLGLRPDWRGLVGFGAFLHFCRLPDQAGGTPPELIDGMLRKLEKDPAELLRRFTRRCGREERLPAPEDTAGFRRLGDDLRLLQRIDLAAPATPPPSLLVHAADDRIVPLGLAEEACCRLGGRLQIFQQGGHALPFNRPKEAARLIREFADAL